MICRPAAALPARNAHGSIRLLAYPVRLLAYPAQPFPRLHARCSSSNEAGTSSYETIKAEEREGVGILTICRPKALNALNTKAMHEVLDTLQRWDRDPSVKVSVITGEGSKAFAAGADIKELAPMTYSRALGEGLLARWDETADIRKPIIAAVNGYALGGGCEVAMMADIILASDAAVFGQPEVGIGVVPGMGATQRLVRAVGKSKAMEMILTGRRMSAGEAERAGLVSRVVPAAELMPEALRLARHIAACSAPVMAKAKDCVSRAFELTLAEGLRYEHREFWANYALEDQKEGMAAFIEKRKPHFRDK